MPPTSPSLPSSLWNTCTWRVLAPWATLALVVVLVVAYGATLPVGGGWSSRERFADASPSCLKVSTYKRYTAASQDLEKALQAAVQRFDDHAKASAASAGAASAGAPAVPDPSDDPLAAGEGELSANAATMPGGGSGGVAQMPGGGGGSGGVTQMPGGGGGSVNPTMPSVESYANPKPTAPTGCMSDYDAAQTAYTQRPQALLKAYNALRTRVNKGIEGLARVRNMQADTAKAEKKRKKQTAEIQKSGAQQEKQLNAYYAQGGAG